MTEWKFKNEFPDLSREKLISFDIETKDPELLTKGPGDRRKDGFICGFSIASDGGFKAYYPLEHSSGNVPDNQKAVAWLKQQLTCGVPIVGANLCYDLCHVDSYFGIKSNSVKYDVQVADALIDENFSTYRLNSIAQRRLGLSKDEGLLYSQGAEFLGIDSKVHEDKEKKKDLADKVKSNLWKLPASLVGSYGEADAALPIQIFRQQEKEMKEQGLWSAFQLECDILDVLIAMRIQGIPVDINKAEQTAVELEKELAIEQAKIKSRVGFDVEIWANASIAKACKMLGLFYPVSDVRISEKTGKEIGGDPKFISDWLKDQDHPFFKMLLNARQVDRCGSVFIKDKIINMAVNGRIHSSFHQVVNDRGGAKSFRFSSSNPNLENIPANNPRLAKKVRSLFTAEKDSRFMVADIKAQEPRLTVHYAYRMGCIGADKAREKYLTDPDTDYHALVGELTGFIEQYGYEKGRKMAKTVNLGKAYGMGPTKYAAKYGTTVKEAYGIFDKYDENMPFIKELSKKCEAAVKTRGWLKTLLGHHCHFNMYWPGTYDPKKKVSPLRKEEALAEWGAPIKQANTYRALNRLIQGSGADMIKKMMVDCFKAGYLCHNTVHDELDFASIKEDHQIKEIHDLMVSSVKLEVPVMLDVEIGKSWGEVEKYEFNS